MTDMTDYVFLDRVSQDNGAGKIGSDFHRGNPREIFAALPTVYVEFDSDAHDRHVVTASIPGESGLWVLAYSSLARLWSARHEHDIEYSAMRGCRVLEWMPQSAGLWYNPSFSGGRQIILPILDVQYEIG
jgi:hypothetical protein